MASATHNVCRSTLGVSERQGPALGLADDVSQGVLSRPIKCMDFLVLLLVSENNISRDFVKLTSVSLSKRQQ